VVVVPALPRGPTGKVAKREIDLGALLGSQPGGPRAR